MSFEKQGFQGEAICRPPVAPWVALWAAVFVAAFLSSSAAARSGFPNDLDAACLAAGRDPVDPAAVARAGGAPLADCALCHSFNLIQGQAPGGDNVSADGRAYDNGDLDPFCKLAAVNTPPEWMPLADPDVSVGELLMFSVRASDADGDTLTLAAADLPLGAEFTDGGGGVGTFSWTPGPGQTGNATVRFLATDDGAPMQTALLELTVTVGGGNRPPMLAPVGDRQAGLGLPVRIDLSASDPDLDPLTFRVEPLPDGARLDPGAGNTAIFEWQPPIAGNHPLTFFVGDGMAEDSEAILITVGGVNVPPVLLPIGNRRVYLGRSIRIGLGAMDPDGDPLAFEAEAPAAAELSDFGDGTAQLDWTPDAPGAVEVTVRVLDDGSPAGMAEETFSISVEEPSALGELVIREARWLGRDRLRLVGEGAGAREPLAILDPASGALLGGRRARRSGEFRMRLWPFMVPCQVVVQAGGRQSEPVDVQGAPADCGERVLTRIHRAVWQCEDATLQAIVSRAPAMREIQVYDGDDGSPLVSGVAGRRGLMHLRAPLAQPPMRISVGVPVGDGEGEKEFLIAPVEVREGASCRSGGDSDSGIDADSDSATAAGDD